MAAPPNTTAATAAVLTLPASVVLDVSEAAAPGHEVWFQYTAVAGDVVLSVWSAATSPGSVYEPWTTVWSGTPAALTSVLEPEGQPAQVPLTVGETYFVQVVNSGGTEPLDSTLTLRVAIAPNVATTAWGLAIPDDIQGFPMAIYAPATGALQQFRPFPAGETAHVLPSGVSVWHDTVGPVVRLYDATLTFQTTPAWTFTGNPPLTSNRVDRFYVGDQGAGAAPARVTTISDTGTLGATVWTLPEVGLTAIGVARDESVLYHVGQTSDVGAVRRWDLGTSLPLTALAAAVSGYGTRDPLVVLDDDTILVGYRRVSPMDSFVRRYAENGTILSTYPLGATDLDHLAYGLTDASFWAWVFLAPAVPAVTRFQEIRVSDGVVLTTFDAVLYMGGIYPTTGSLPPPAFFGHSNSCPFTLLPPLPPYGPPTEPPVEPPGPGATTPSYGGGGTPTMCLAGPPQAACWAPHDLAALQISLVTEDQQP